LDSLGVTEELQKQSDFTAKLYDVVITNDWMSLRIPNLPEYQNVIEYIMKIYPNVEINIGITPIKEFKFKI
jgi:hypothetical protein